MLPGYIRSVDQVPGEHEFSKKEKRNRVNVLRADVFKNLHLFTDPERQIDKQSSKTSFYSKTLVVTTFSQAFIIHEK